MRWMWIDRIVSLDPGKRIVTIKGVSQAEEHLHDHFAADPARGLPAVPVMPASLIIEGMAQSAGVLVGHAGAFKEKVVLAKIGRAELTRDAAPGCTLRYTATLDRIDAAGASTSGLVELIDHTHANPRFEEIGRIDLMFAHADNNMSGASFPAHNFVFSDAFRTLLRLSGIPADF